MTELKKEIQEQSSHSVSDSTLLPTANEMLNMMEGLEQLLQ